MNTSITTKAISNKYEDLVKTPSYRDLTTEDLDKLIYCLEYLNQHAEVA